MKTKPTVRTLLAAALVGLVVGFAAVNGCASLPLKQKAVVSLQASETALEAAHDAERALCSPTADQTKAITHCDGTQAVAIGLTDARHHDLAVLFVKAFGIEIDAATALKAWKAGDPAPSSVAEYQQVIDQILALVKQIVPATDAIATKVQQAVDQAAIIAGIVGVK